MITDWIAATATVGATIVAVVAVLVGRRTSRDALAAQAEVVRESHQHELALLRDERLWTRRADLYARIAEAVRAHVEEEFPKLAPPRDARLTGLVAEADVFASREMRDWISQFVYDDPPMEVKIDLWAEIQAQARAELIGPANS